MQWLERVGVFCRGRVEGLGNVGLGFEYTLLGFLGRRTRVGREECRGVACFILGRR